MTYNYSDIMLNQDGDTVVGPPGDLYITKNVDALKQGVEERLRTDLGDLFTHPKFGNRLKEQIGKRNTRATAEEGKLTIISCLTYDGFVDESNLEVAAVPIDATNILYHIEINDGTYVVYKFDLICDLENGIRRP